MWSVRSGQKCDFCHFNHNEIIYFMLNQMIISPMKILYYPRKGREFFLSKRDCAKAAYSGIY